MLRPWIRLEEDSKDDNNPDIEDYIGRGDLTAFYKWKQNDFSLMLRHSLKGGDDSHGAVQFDWASQSVESYAAISNYLMVMVKA